MSKQLFSYIMAATNEVVGKLQGTCDLYVSSPSSPGHQTSPQASYNF